MKEDAHTGYVLKLFCGNSGDQPHLDFSDSNIVMPSDKKLLLFQCAAREFVNSRLACEDCGPQCPIHNFAYATLEEIHNMFASVLLDFRETPER